MLVGLWVVGYAKVRTYNGAATLFLNAAAHTLMVMGDVQKRDGKDARNGKYERKESSNTKRRCQNKLLFFSFLHVTILMQTPVRE